MLITDKINRDTVVIPLNGLNRSDVIQELLDVLVERGYLMESIKLFSFIDAKETQSCSVIGGGIALPHSISKEIDDLVCILGISKIGIPYDEKDTHSCHIILLSLSPIKNSDIHRKFISKFRLLLSDSQMKDKMINSTSAIDLEREIQNWEKQRIEEDV
jgi:mannitol/fructose-specific phosphotransferase system IIA component (Ntr-type)